MDQLLSVLIVDDEFSIRNGLTTAISWEEIGIKVVGTASDGIEALYMMHALKPNIVITDIRMPRCDGLELIKKSKEQQLNCKFIILSGYDDFSYAKTAMRYNVSLYLTKPINRTELIEELCELKTTLLKEMSENVTLKTIKHQIIMQNRALKENFYTKLLENEYKSGEEIKTQLNSLQLNLNISASRVLIFTYSFEEHTDDVLFNSQNNTLFQSAIINIIEEVFNDLPSVVFVKDSFSIIAIINVVSNDNPTTNQVKLLCQKVLDHILDFSGIKIYAAIGDVTQTLISAKDSYLNALEALSYQLYEPEQQLFDSSTISRDVTPVISPKAQKNSEIVDAIYRGDIKELDFLLADFFSSIFYTELPPPSYIRGICIFLMINVQNELSAYLEENSSLFSDSPFVEINKCSTFRAIKQWITNKFYVYTEYIQKNCSFKKDPIIQRAKAYIADNIYKKIRAEDVAAYVGLSENYFTVYFKEKTNENFKNYVQNLKMEKAKEHLKTSNISINELSYLLGYEDYRSFNRAFKKETGITPSEYHQNYQRTNNK